LLGAASWSGRAQKRQALGTLKDLRVRAATRKRHAQAYARFSWHVQVFALTVGTFFELDDALTHYIEHLWHEGEPRLWVGDSLAAVHYYLPTSKRQLPVAWSLHKAWGKSELQARACPLTLPMLHGICGLLVQWGFWRDALVALCAFDLVLRTGEALELRAGDIEATKARVGMVLKLRQTKVGRRRGADEFVVVDDSLVQKPSSFSLRTVRQETSSSVASRTTGGTDGTLQFGNWVCSSWTCEPTPCAAGDLSQARVLRQVPGAWPVGQHAQRAPVHRGGSSHVGIFAPQ
jgi:hypothetical protein